MSNDIFILKLIVCLLSFFILWPIFNLIGEGIYGIKKGSFYLSIDRFVYEHI